MTHGTRFGLHEGPFSPARLIEPNTCPEQSKRRKTRKQDRSQKRRRRQEVSESVPRLCPTRRILSKGLPCRAVGNLQRNLIRLPSTFNTDLALFKNVPLGEKRTFQFRWETYNLFNRANFTDINGAMTFDANGVQTSTTFGTARASRTSRVMQASLRINF